MALEPRKRPRSGPNIANPNGLPNWGGTSGVVDTFATRLASMNGLRVKSRRVGGDPSSMIPGAPVEQNSNTGGFGGEFNVGGPVLGGMRRPTFFAPPAERPFNFDRGNKFGKDKSISADELPINTMILSYIDREGDTHAYDFGDAVFTRRKFGEDVHDDKETTYNVPNLNFLLRQHHERYLAQVKTMHLITRRGRPSGDVNQQQLAEDTFSDLIINVERFNKALSFVGVICGVSDPATFTTPSDSSTRLFTVTVGQRIEGVHPVFGNTRCPGDRVGYAVKRLGVNNALSNLRYEMRPLSLVPYVCYQRHIPLIVSATNDYHRALDLRSMHPENPRYAENHTIGTMLTGHGPPEFSKSAFINNTVDDTDPDNVHPAEEFDSDLSFREVAFVPHQIPNNPNAQVRKIYIWCPGHYIPLGTIKFTNGTKVSPADAMNAVNGTAAMWDHLKVQPGHTILVRT